MEAGKKYSILVTKPGLSQMKDTGMAFTLICLIISFLAGSRSWLIVGASLLFINMLYPRFFYIPAILWFSLANILGLLSSKVLLMLIFFFVITPIGITRRFFRIILRSKNYNSYDSMKLKQWKMSTDSVFKTRNHKFIKDDLIKPY